jgi:hypothetical protein
MADPGNIITALEQAKAKLAAAQRQAQTGAGKLGKLRDQVQWALGRDGANNPAIGKLRNAERDIKARAAEISALSARIDKAIAQARHAAVGTGAAGPAPARAQAPNPGAGNGSAGQGGAGRGSAGTGNPAA